MTAATAAPDIDPVAVDRAIHGHPGALTDAERDEVIRRLTAAGRSAAHIGALLGITGRHVARIRGRLGIRGTNPGGPRR